MSKKKSGRDEEGKAAAKVEELDPRLNELRLDLNAMVLWEEAAGRPFGEFNGSLADFRLLLWAGMKSQIPDITLEQVGSMITAGNVAAVKALLEAKFPFDVGALTL